MSKHTKGPWKTHLVDSTAIVTEDGKLIAKAEGDYHLDHAAMEANARLIAAAPDLLEALELLQAGWSKNAITAGTWAIARAAIAKAKGEA
jgi:hypothetical protein